MLTGRAADLGGPGLGSGEMLGRILRASGAVVHKKSSGHSVHSCISGSMTSYSPPEEYATGLSGRILAYTEVSWGFLVLDTGAHAPISSVKLQGPREPRPRAALSSFQGAGKGCNSS